MPKVCQNGQRLLAWFRWSNRKAASFYFDPKDFAYYEQGSGRTLPLAAKDNTFESLLKIYVDVMELLVTVAAASIAFR